MLKILQARLQQYVNREFPDVQAGLEKAEVPKNKLPTSIGSSKKPESSRKISTSALLTIPKPLAVWITTNCGKFFKRWEYQTILRASWEICTQVKKKQNWTWNNRLVPYREHQGCISSPCLFNVYAEYIMQQAGLEEAQAGIKTARRNINILRYADDTTLMAESEEELKSLLMKWKRRVKKLA